MNEMSESRTNKLFVLRIPLLRVYIMAIGSANLAQTMEYISSFDYARVVSMFRIFYSLTSRRCFAHSALELWWRQLLKAQFFLSRTYESVPILQCKWNGIDTRAFVPYPISRLSHEWHTQIPGLADRTVTHNHILYSGISNWPEIFIHSNWNKWKKLHALQYWCVLSIPRLVDAVVKSNIAFSSFFWLIVSEKYRNRRTWL